MAVAKAKSAKKEKKQKLSFQKLWYQAKLHSLPAILLLTLAILLFTLYQTFIANKFYPLTFVGSANVSFMTEGHAIKKIQNNFLQRSAQKLQFGYNNNSFTIDLATSSAGIDYTALDETLIEQKSGNVATQIKHQLLTLINPEKISPKISLNLDRQIDPISQAIEIPYKNAEITFDETITNEGTPAARIQIKDGENGLGLDKEKLQEIIAAFLLSGETTSELPIKVVPPKVTSEYVKSAKLALEEIQKKPIKLVFEKTTYFLDTKQLLALLDLEEGTNLLDKDKTQQYIKKIAADIDQEVQEGLFEFNQDTKRVSGFRPSQEGRKLNAEKTYALIVEALSGNQKIINLPVDIIKPKIQTGDVNSLGIKELLGRGKSSFAGSIPNRIYNVNLTTAKLNGVLIPAGEIFSFNQTVGDITAATGFKQAYVIKEGRTVLDDGGGVCQDSTTLFRAVLNAGLPVIKRTAHAYRVGYYEQGFPPGLDATVFYPSVDLQFKNDTGHHILIQAYTAGLTLYIDLYGTSDGRVVSLSKPVVTDRIPAPPELRQDDPTLPKGTVKQVDWAAQGAKVRFTRIVYRNGEELIKETWTSNYKPWQAVYLVGTKE